MTDVQIQEFKDIFSGSQSSYGKFVYGDTKKGLKVEGRASTVKQTLVTFDEYKKHLKGEQGLGIVPINEENKVKFAVIDVDIYDRDLLYFVNAIERYNFPLLPFKSKSGGLHIYLFLNTPESAKEVIKIMKQLAFLLTIDLLVKQVENRTVEIFPKQAVVQAGQSGSWINLPYHNVGDTCKNFAIFGGKNLSVQDALFKIREKSTSLQGVKDFIEGLPFSDAPPCLQRVLIVGDTTAHSGRNNFLFSCGVYLKKKDEQYFEDELRNVNKSIVSPIDDQELDITVINSLKKKDYMYKCSESPLCDYCDKSVCRKRDFGVGVSEGYFSTVELGKLTQWRTEQPYYEWQLKLHGQDKFKTLRFNDEMDIIRQDKFLILVMRDLHELPVKIKQAEWHKVVNSSLKEIEVIKVNDSDDTSPKRLLKDEIYEFLSARTQAQNKEQILLKRAFVTKDDYYLFRPRDMANYIWVVKRFPHFSSGELHGILREIGGEFVKINTEKRKQIRVCKLPLSAFGNIAIDTNDEAFKPDFSAYVEEEQF